MSTSKRVTLGLSVLALCCLGACHIVVSEPDEGERSWWYYCDEYSCYRCSASGCLFPDYPCDSGDCGTCSPGDDRCGSVTLLCDVMRDCDEGQVCVDGECRPTPRPCRGHADCGDGAYCSDGQCLPSGLCDVDGGCAGVGEDFSCDVRGCCVPGPTGPDPCSSATECGEGGMCVGGQCGSCSGDCGGGETCELDRHCGEGRACVDGQCVNQCSSDVQCGSNQVCNTTAGLCVSAPVRCDAQGSCDAGLICLNGVCHPDCTNDGVCANEADTCSDALLVGQETLNVCVPRHAANPECALSKDCTDNEQCVNGICRTMCAVDPDCANCEDGPVCGKGGFCMTEREASPQCKSDADCSVGQVCHDTQCVAL